MSTDLWPDFEIAKRPRTVKGILLDAGEGLAEKTADLIKFVVWSESTGPDKFYHDCYLSVPKLGYRYPFFKVLQGIEQYPVKIVADTFPRDVTVQNEAEFMKRLEELFHSEETKKLVGNLVDAVS